MSYTDAYAYQEDNREDVEEEEQEEREESDDGEREQQPQSCWEDFQGEINDARSLQEYSMIAIRYAASLANKLPPDHAAKWTSTLMSIVDAVKSTKLKGVEFKNTSRTCTIDAKDLNLCAYKTQILPMVWYHMQSVALWVQKPDKGPQSLDACQRQTLLALLASGIVNSMPMSSVVKTMSKSDRNHDVDYTALERFASSRHFKTTFALTELLCVFVARSRCSVDEDTQRAGVDAVMELLSKTIGGKISEACNKNDAFAKSVFRCKNIKSIVRKKPIVSKVIASIKVYDPKQRRKSTSSEDRPAKRARKQRSPSPSSSRDEAETTATDGATATNVANATNATKPPPAVPKEKEQKEEKQETTTTSTEEAKKAQQPPSMNFNADDARTVFMHELLLDLCVHMDMKNALAERSLTILEDLANGLARANTKRALYTSLMMIAEAALVLTGGPDGRTRRKRMRSARETRETRNDQIRDQILNAADPTIVGLLAYRGDST